MAAPTPPKAMSSRLLTMKFMQRAAASAPTTPTASPKSEEQSSKRRKVSHESTANAPVDFMVNQQAVQAAIDEGEKKREEAIVKHAAELGDARWVLDVPDSPFNSLYQVKKPLNVVQVGYAQIDSPDATEHDTDSVGDSLEKGHLFRRYNMDKKKVPAESSKSNESSDDDDDNDDEDSASDADSSEDDGPGRKSYGGQNSPATPRIPSKRSAEREKARELAEKRRKKEVKLNSAKPAGLSSISSGGGISSGSRQGQPGAASPSFKCHNCGKPGHSFKSCPNKRR
ncbi:zinc knuckle [Apiospora rasikravindrae]|uniref:Zinc knuckle n=1 Tax=Apiospora rasikravindrae TaxID=990691 RepID=A0ABR1T8G4_9PEZI